jgi:threonine dehydrogenase-like Zn-dependent dehydrogenase
MCFTDVDYYTGNFHVSGVTTPYPWVLGHEIVGRIERLGDQGAVAGLSEGARVALETTLGCGSCKACVEGQRTQCRQMFKYAHTPTSVGSGLWGGYAEYMVLKPGTIVHEVPEHLSPQDAVLFNPFGSGYDWAVRLAGTCVGETVLIIGPGQRGLACVLAAREAGAARVIMAGRSYRRLWAYDIARQFGATDVIHSDKQDLVETVREITDGKLADRVIDTSSHSTQPVVDAINAARKGGTIVLAGVKDADVPIDANRIFAKALTIRGAASSSFWGREQAMRMVASGAHSFDKYHTHTFRLEDTEKAIQTLAGEVAGEEAMHITVVAE